MSDPDAAAAAAAALVAAEPAILETFATDFIGFSIATTIYGITLLQTYFYFRGYPKDNFSLKSLVALLWVLDTFSSVLTAHAIYTFQITNFGNFLAAINIPWSFRLENGIVAMITFIVQLYFAERLWRLSKSKALVIITSLLAATSFALGLEATIELLIHSGAGQVLGTKSNLIISGLQQGIAALCDIIITAGLCYYLHIGRSGMQRSEVLIDTLIIYTINRGILTAVVQTLFLITNVAFPKRQIWLPFHQAVGKLYVNSLLATLNVRTGLHSIGWSQNEASLADPTPFNKSNSHPLSRLGIGRGTTGLKSTDMTTSRSMPHEMEINVMKTQITDGGNDYNMKPSLFKSSFDPDT